MMKEAVHIPDSLANHVPFLPCPKEDSLHIKRARLDEVQFRLVQDLPKLEDVGCQEVPVVLLNRIHVQVV